jgi:hypothetical protein
MRIRPFLVKPKSHSERSEAWGEDIAKFPSVGTVRAREPATTAIGPEWTELLDRVRQSQATAQAAEQRASKIAARAEAVAREAIEELHRLQQALESGRTERELAEQRVASAETRAFQAEFKAELAEAELAKREDVLQQLQQELWSFVRGPSRFEERESAAA